MNQCTLSQQKEIIDIIQYKFILNRETTIKDLESEISENVIKDFKFAEFKDNSEITKELIKNGINIEELFDTDSSSTIYKSNVVKNISTYSIDDLFKGIPVAKKYFDSYLGEIIVREAIIGRGDSDHYVDSDHELSENFSNLKNKLFIEIQEFLQSEGLLSTDVVELFENDRVIDYAYYNHIMGLVSDYFFSGENVGLLTFEGKLVPNLNIDLDSKEHLFKAYNNTILLTNFDSIINTEFKGMIEINYNYFNHLNNSIGRNPKYRIKVEANSLLYWNRDNHDSKNSENKEDQITKMVVNSIPAYNKNNQKLPESMEMKDLYLLGSMIHSFELRYGNKFKNNDAEFEYFNKNPGQSLVWYLQKIIQAFNKEGDYISEFNDSLKIGERGGFNFRDVINLAYSLNNYINDPELNILAKEKTSTNSLLSIIGQVINNNFGVIYSVFNTDTGLEVQNMHQQDFNSTYINNTVLSYMVTNALNKDMYDLKNKEELDKFNGIFDAAFEEDRNQDIYIYSLNNPSIVEEFSEYISEKTGIPFSNFSFVDLINEMKTQHNKTRIEVSFFKNKVSEFINSINKDFKNKTFKRYVTKATSLTSGKVLNNTVSNAFYKSLSKTYLMNFITKPAMNLTTQLGSKVPSFRTSTLTFKDTEIFDLQRTYEKAEGTSYRSLLLKDSPAILGTSTKLEVTNPLTEDEYNSVKDAAKLTPQESFIADFRYEFWDSLMKQDTFQIILGNYSDKNTVFTKIINGRFQLEGSNKIIIQEDMDVLLETVRTQAFKYYSDTFKKVFKDYKELFSKTGFENEANQITDDFENNIKVINNVLLRNNIIDLLSIYAELPFSLKNPNLTITEELHYSNYSGGTSINQLLADNYRIFGNINLFNEFVSIQEQSFLDKTVSNQNNTLNHMNAAKGDFNQIASKLGLNFDEFSDEFDKIQLKSGKLNPIVRKWMWLNALFRNEYTFMTSKGEYMHPHKNNSTLRSGEFNGDYWAKYSLEMSGRLDSMAKRNVIFTASIEAPVRNSKYGTTEKVNIAAIQDSKAQVYTSSGHKEYNQDAYDGSSYIEDLHSRMLAASFPGKGYGGTMKQFGTMITPYSVTLKKDAETVLTNDRIRNSHSSTNSLLNKKKQMLSIPLNDIIFNDDVLRFEDLYINHLGKQYQIYRVELTNESGQNKLKLFNSLVEDNDKLDQPVLEVNVNTLYDIWDAFGGIYSIDEKGNFNEKSNEALYNVVTETNDGKLKNKLIHILSNVSSLKAGATNINSSARWQDSKPLLYSSYDNRFMGPQLDASHGIDNSEIKEVTQLVSALAQGGFTSEVAQEAYEDIANVIKTSAQPYLNSMKADDKKLYYYLTDKFIETINNAKGESIAKTLIHSIKEDGINIPFSNNNFFGLFVRDVVTRLNNEFISRHYSGIGSILIPSHGIFQVYDRVLPDGRTIVMTQADLIKEALQEYDSIEFERIYGRQPVNNEEIIEFYKSTILADLPVNIGEIEVGDTVLINGQNLSLSTPEEYYKFKKEYSGNEALGFSQESNLPTISSTLYELEPNITDEKIRTIYDNYIGLMNKHREGKGVSFDNFKGLLNKYQVYKYKDTYIFGQYDINTSTFITRMNSSPTSKELLAEAIPNIVEKGIDFISFVPKDYADKLVRSGYISSTSSFKYDFKGEVMDKFAVASNPNVFNKIFNKGYDNVTSEEIEQYNHSQDLKYVPVEINAELIKKAGKDTSKIFETYLNQFGIIVKDIDEIKDKLGIDEVGFADLLSKIAYVKDKKDLPPIAGEFIAYMMQYNPLVKDIITELSKTDKYKNLDKSQYFKIIGELISQDLQNKTKGNYNQSLIGKIKELINEFLELFKSVPIDIINTNIGIISNNILQQNKKLITSSLYKPGAFGKPVQQVSIEEALEKDKFGSNIIYKLSKQGFILTGSTALSEQGVILRPDENPLHDIDWVSPFSRKETEEKFLKSYPNAIKVRDIHGDDYVTDSYLIAPEGYSIANYKADNFNGKIIINSYDVVDSKGNVVGTYRLQKQESNNQSEEVVTGIEGKVIDFFSFEDYSAKNPNNSFNYKSKEGTVIKLANWKDVFKAKLDFARYKDIWDYNRFIPNENNQQNKIYKVYSKPRDLKPTSHTFKVNGQQRNIFDFKSLELLYKNKEIIDSLNKGEQIVIDSSVILLNDFSNYISHKNNKSFDLLNNLNKNSIEVLKVLEKYLRQWVQRDFELLHEGLAMTNHISNFSEYFGNDNFTDVLSDVIENYRLHAQPVTDVVFKSAEKVVGDIYQTNFGRDLNDSMYEINKKGALFFKEKLLKYYGKDNVEADLKIISDKSDKPIYIKYVDELGLLDRTINIKSSIKSEDDLKRTYIRYNELGEEIYSFTDSDNVRVSTDEDGNEIIYVRFGKKYNDDRKRIYGHHKTKSFEKNVKGIIKSFKGSIKAVVPLMNRDARTTSFFSYDENGIIPKGNYNFNFGEFTTEVFKNFTGIEVVEDHIYSSNWFERNKDNILDRMSNSMYISWQKSHELIDARIPGQSMQSFMPMKNIAYMNTTTNDSYVSITQVFLQGSDFDIDKAYTLGSGFTSNGKLDLWTNLSEYSSIEQLNELEKLPLPTNRQITLANPDITEELNLEEVKNINATEDYNDIVESIAIYGETMNTNYQFPVETIKLFNKFLRKYSHLDNIVITSVSNRLSREKFINLINAHNLDSSFRNKEGVVKNSVVSRIKQIISDPRNQILANTPVTVQDWHDAIKIVEDRKSQALINSSHSGNVKVAGKEGIPKFMDSKRNRNYKAMKEYAIKNGYIYTLREQGDEHFGNPYSNMNVKGTIPTKSTKESVEKFINWILYNPDEIQENRRQWILTQLRNGSLKNKPLLYYNDLREPSHANALDYLINQFDWSNNASKNNIKPGVSELFDSNPELANTVYEALGFKEENTNYYEGDITPELNTVFVFGSNPEGRHGLGAAKIARQQFGAIYGQGEGLQGNAYALPTKDLRVKENRGLKSISPEQIIDSIIKLYDVAEQNPNKQFKVAYRNTTKESLNGYTGLEMIEMFNDAAQIGIGYIPSNVIFSKEWVDTGKLNIQFQITPEQKQQAQQWYSQYLDTIFPDSKVKDIVYHGVLKGKESYNKILTEGFRTTGVPKFQMGISEDENSGIYFSTDFQLASDYGTEYTDVKDDGTGKRGMIVNHYIIPAIVNIKNLSPEFGELSSDILRIKKNDPTIDGVQGIEPDTPYNVTVVFEPEQIHILGSKQDIEGFKDFVGTENNASNYTNHSGGAEGSDSYWDYIGRTHGLKNHRHYFIQGFNTPKGNVGLSSDFIKEATEHVLNANKTLRRRYPTKDAYIDNLLLRNWAQVKNADTVFAIGKLKGNEVEGGTGWAVQMAIDNLKPVFVFDQFKNNWYEYNYELGLFKKSDIPVLTKNFAGIGTREINSLGIQAIKDVYNKTLGTIDYDSTEIYREITKNTEVKNLKGEERPLITESFLETNKKFRGIPVIISDDFKGAASFNRKTKTIQINIPLMKQKFEEKAWSKPNTLKDNTKVNPFPEEQFSNFEEWLTFVILHEYYHSKLERKRFDNGNLEPLNVYENRINEHAFKTLRDTYNTDIANVDESKIEMATEEKSTKLNNKKLLSSYDMMSYYIQQYNASVGKDDVGIAANGVKTLYALSSYYNTYYKNNNFEPDLVNSFKSFNKNFTFLKNGELMSLGGNFTTIADVQMNNVQRKMFEEFDSSFNIKFVNAANNLSGFLSAATDNAKELIMAKVNASTDLASMHIYLMILGLDIDQVVEIMTTDIMEDIINKMDHNVFGMKRKLSFNTVISELSKTYKNRGDNDSIYNLNTYLNIYKAASELTSLSTLLGINQKRKATTWEIYNYLNTFSKTLINSERNKIPTNILETYKLRKNPEEIIKYIHTISRQTNIEEVVNSAHALGIIGGGFDFERYFAEPSYKQATKEYYNLIKETFNVFDILDEVPHIREMVNSLVLFHNILKKYSTKYNYIFDLFRDSIGDTNPTEDIIKRGILYNDSRAREEWFKTDKMLNFSFNLKDLMRMAKKDTFTLYTSSSAQKNSEKEKHSVVVDINDDSNPLISLENNEGIANFKNAFEQLLLPILQSNLKNNNFLKLENTINPFGAQTSHVAPTVATSNINVPALVKQFQKALKTFDELDTSFDINYQIKNNLSEFVKWKDIIFVYNLIVNNERYGDKRITPLLQNYMHDKNSLGYDYIKFWSRIDNGLELMNESSETDIKFYVNNKQGIDLARSLYGDNPDFPIITNVQETEQIKIHNKNINDIIRLIKEGGYIITLKC